MPIGLSSHLRRAARVAVLALAALVLLVPSAQAGTYTWDLAEDFVSSPAPVNPNPDRYGTADAWSFRQGSPLLHGLYSPLTATAVDHMGIGLAAHTGTDSDDDGTELPYVAYNPTASPKLYVPKGVTFGAHAVVVKPSATTMPVVTFTAPTAGTYAFTGVVAKTGAGCGDGVRWTAERSGVNVASGTLGGTGSATMTIADQALAAGDKVDVTVDAGVAGLNGCDETALTVHATLEDITAPAPTVDAIADTTNTSPTFTGGRDTAFGDGPVTVRVYAGGTATGTPVATVAATGGGATWTSAALPSPLADGTYTVEATQTDVAGNTGSSAVDQTFRVDTTAPSLTLATPTAGAATGARPAFSGVAGIATGDSATVTVRVYSGTVATGAPLQTLTTSRDGQTGAYSVTPGSDLAEGTYTAIAAQDDSLGNTGTSTPPTTFVVDVTAPTPSLSSPPARTGVATPAISGTAGTASGDQATVTVDVYAGSTAIGVPLQTLTTSRDAQSGAFSVSPTALGDGQYTALARQSDAAGNAGTSASRTFTVDLTAPSPAPTINAVATPNTNGLPSFSGTAAAAASGDAATVTVEIYAGSTATGIPVQTITAARALGTWSATPLPALPEGSYAVRVTHSDDVGNVAVSATRTFRVDLAAPAPTVTSPATRTNDPTPTLAGVAGAATGDASTVTLRIWAGTDTNATPLQQLVVARSGASWSTTAASLADGLYTATVSQGDDAGRSGSGSRQFTVDTVAPSVSMDATASRTAAAPALSGTAETGANDASTVEVRVYAGSSASGSPVQTLSGVARDGSTGAWSVTPAALADGTYTAQVRQDDAAGNTGLSVARTFTVDGTGPALTLDAPVTPSSQTTPSLGGTAGTATGDAASVTVKIYAGSSATGSPAQTLTATPSGGTYAVTPAALADGTWTAQAVQVDDLANTTTSPARTFVVDTTAPTVGMDATASRTAAAPALSGIAGTATGDASTVEVRVFEGGSASGSPVQTLSGVARDGSTGAWSVTPAALADGTYTAQVRQDDAAGNTGLGVARTFTVDGTGPALTLDAPVTPSSQTTPSLGGTAGTATGDAASVTVKVYAGSSASGSPAQTLTATPSGGTYAVTPAALADGTWTAQAVQVDDLANTTTSPARTFVVDTTAPVVTLGAVADATAPAYVALGGTGGTATGDAADVTLRIYTGTTASGTPVRTLTATRDGQSGAYTATVSDALPAGTYTATATQTDAVGNAGHGTARTFRVVAPAPPPTPEPTPTPTPEPTPTPTPTPTPLSGTLTAPTLSASGLARASTVVFDVTLSTASRVSLVVLVRSSDAARLGLHGSRRTISGVRYVVVARRAAVSLPAGRTALRVSVPSATRKALRRARGVGITSVATATANGETKTLVARRRLTR